MNRRSLGVTAKTEYYKEWVGRKMEESLFHVAAVINGRTVVPALIDSGSSPYAILNDVFARNNGECFEIEPRNLGGVGGATAVHHICYFSLDIDGHRQARVFAYVVPDCPPSLILGQPWIREEGVTYQPIDDTYTIGSSGTVVRRTYRDISLLILSMCTPRTAR